MKGTGGLARGDHRPAAVKMITKGTDHLVGSAGIEAKIVIKMNSNGWSLPVDRLPKFMLVQKMPGAPGAGLLQPGCFDRIFLLHP